MNVEQDGVTSGRINGGGALRKLGARIAAAFDAFVRPMLQRPNLLQTGALCHRREGDRTQVLMISSRGTGRWIIPKGWLMRGKNAGEAALVEAWEEAGVRAVLASDRPIGSYVYDKITKRGLPVSVETLVFSVEVQALEDDFPETGQRQRRWVDPDEAAGMVAEPGLKQILLDLDTRLRH
ncbi:MAG: NUDIX hydrolase [Marinibacterium profundimaris]